MTKDKRTASWHCHDKVLCEWDSRPRKKRTAYIKKTKPAHEQEPRLRLYQPMSKEAVKLMLVRDEAVAQARKVRDKALAQARKPLEKIHKLECPNCPWDGSTIFPKAKNPHRGA